MAIGHAAVGGSAVDEIDFQLEHPLVIRTSLLVTNFVVLMPTLVIRTSLSRDSWFLRAGF